MQRHWYAIHTYSGHEKKVLTNLERRADTMGIKEKVIDIFVAEKEETKNRDGKKVVSKMKLFPGYVFINMVLDEETWYLVKSTTGVINFVSAGNSNKPQIVQDSEIEGIKAVLDPANPINHQPTWEVGQIIRVTSGNFEDMTGKIDEVDERRQRLKVLISLFGRDTPVELDFNMVEKI
jgi:transcription termination/antitermination protein NusG